MRGQRKTSDQRTNEWWRSEQEVWDAFEPKLASLATFVDAELLVKSPPNQDEPGRNYYSNLGYFLQYFHVPAGASTQELRHYLTFVRRLDAAGELKDGACKRVAEALEQRLRELGLESQP